MSVNVVFIPTLLENIDVLIFYIVKSGVVFHTPPFLGIIALSLSLECFACLFLLQLDMLHSEGFLNSV